MEGRLLNQQPLISVVIPVWNGAKYIESCLQSVLAQDVEDMEIIVVDDGSTDGTWELLTRLAASDARIQPFHQENAGASVARNTGLARCQGKYIRFVDADDTVPAGSMRALLDSAEEHGSDLVLAAYTEVLAGSRSLRCLHSKDEAIGQEEFLRRLERLANSFYYGVLWNKLFRGDIIREHKPRFVPGLHWGEDFVFVMDYLAHCRRYSYVSAPVYDYIRNPNGLVVRQFFRSITHPIESLKDRWKVYTAYRTLYQRVGAYEEYKHKLWHYLIRFTLRN